MTYEPQPSFLPAQPVSAPTAAPRELASLVGYSERVAGCLLGTMCGDVLGAAVEGWDHEQVLLANPDGLDSFLHTERGFGCYTDDTQMAIALARSLLATGGRVDDVAAARAYADEYQAHRGYGGTAYKILSGIKQSGIDAASIRTIGTKYIPGGSFGNGGAMRIAPVGLVYRHAPPAVLREAVSAALRCTHVHPTAVDGAFVVALAVGYLATRKAGDTAAAEPAAASGSSGTSSSSRSGGGDLANGLAALSDPCRGSSDGTGGAGTHGARTAGVEDSDGGDGGDVVSEGVAATPVGLLDHLLAHRALLETEEMAAKLRAVKAALLSAPAFKAAAQPWADYFASPGWAAELRLHDQVSEQFQIRADDAAAVALLALCWHWAVPEDAVVAAVHYGGDTDTVAAITGAMAGALHGAKWIPPRWISNLENGPAGRDELLHLATRLAQLDTRS